MYSRSDLRHACYRAKSNNNVVAEKHKPLLQVIEPLLPDYATWDNFTDRWDIFIDKNKDIHIVVPERNINFIEKTCLEAKFKAQNNIPVSFDDNLKKQNVVDIVELSMLDELTKWESYDEKWSVYMDEQKFINVKLINKKKTQIEVTDDMIIKSIDDNRILLNQDQKDELLKQKEENKKLDTVLEMKEATPKQKKQIEKLLKNKKDTKGSE
tara:strand:- start:208 stop:840 length:633 start_codon:yes stop_codon:yes gene_type:complete